MMHYQYILKGHKAVKAVDIFEWGMFMQKKDRIVKQETLPNGIQVSTVFLGLDHNYGGGRPILFETMVFGAGEEGFDNDMDRYHTWIEAVAGHIRMVKKWKVKKI